MSQIQTKFIANNAVTTAKIAADAVSGAKIRLDNVQALRARNAANSADVDALRVNASDLLELLTNVELSDRKLLNALVNFSTQASDPGSPAQGDVYYNTVSNKLRQYNGATWEDVSSGVAGANTSLSNLASVAINEDLVFNKTAPAVRSKDEAVAATQPMTIKTGDAAADASGDLTIATGSAGTTRGEMLVGARNITLTADNDVAVNATSTATLGTLSASGQINVVTSQSISVNDSSSVISIRSGDTTGAGVSGTVEVKSGQTEDGNSGELNLSTGAPQGVTSGNSGDINIFSGAAAAAPNGTSGEIAIITGQADGASGNVEITTGQSISAASGHIQLTTAAGVDADSQGEVQLGAKRVRNSTILKLHDLAADPTDLSVYEAGDMYFNTTSDKVRVYDGAVWADVGVAATLPTNEKTLISLSAGDITNQYVDLAHVARTNSIDFLVRGGGVMVEGASYDYSVSYTGGAGGNTRITFLNDLATGGASALVASDVVVVKYERI